MNDAIQLENLTKRYPNFSLDNVSLSLPRGCIMGLIGKNGAGKTTTLKLLLGLRRPDGGKITLLGLPLEGHEAEIKSRLGVALDDNRFSEAFSPKDVNRILRLVHSRWDETYFRSLADRFGLPWTMPLKKYSRGMKMKLSLSAALAHRRSCSSWTRPPAAWTRWPGMKFWICSRSSSPTGRPQRAAFLPYHRRFGKGLRLYQLPG